MKKKAPAPSPAFHNNATDWIRWLWEVEAEHSPMVGSRLKFGLPSAPATQQRRRAKATRRITAKA